MATRELNWNRILGQLRDNIFKPQIEQLADYLAENDYSLTTTEHYLRITLNIGNWIEARGISPLCLEEKHIREFHQTFIQPRKQKRMGPSRWCNVRAAGNHLLRLLRKSEKHGHPVMDRFQKALQEFSCYLQEIHGLQQTTIGGKCRYLNRFLREKLSDKLFRPDLISPKSIHDYVVEYSRSHSSDATWQLISALKSYYQYLLCKGRRTIRQLKSIPGIPAWRTTAQPTVLSKSQQSRFLKAFDRSTPIGKRDYAMAICMLELGLRSIDIADLELEHIDWRQAILTVPNTKCRHQYILPLTAIVGEALSDYIRNGRSASSSSHVFLRVTPPKGPLSSGGVHWPINCAFLRAGITGASGTHILRRSIASRIHASGGSVKEIADFLGHTSLETAGKYARTDEKLLRAFVLPWPEGSR